LALDDFISGANVAREQRQPKCIGPVPDPDGVFATTIGSELPLEVGDERSTRKSASVDHPSDGAIDFRAERSVMGLQIKKWHSHVWISLARE